MLWQGSCVKKMKCSEINFFIQIAQNVIVLKVPFILTSFQMKTKQMPKMESSKQARNKFLLLGIFFIPPTA